MVLAVALLTAVFSMRHEIPYGMYRPAVVGWCLPGYPAAQAGVKEGDQILQIADTQNPTWQDVQNKVLISPNQPLALVVKRGTEELPLTLLPKVEGKQQSGDAGWQPQQPFVVTGLEPDMPGIQAGLQVGDEILSVDGKPIHATGAMQAYLQTDQGQAGTSGSAARKPDDGADGDSEAERGGRAYADLSHWLHLRAHRD